MTAARTARDEDGTPAGVAVLVVCTANICRSPVGERLLAARLAGAGVTVGSAGTRALTGAAIDPPMAALLGPAGARADGFAARQLRPELVRDAALVLAMSREHRAAAVSTLPAAVRRTFLLADAADLAEAVAASGWPAQVAPTPAARLAALPSLAAPHRPAARGVEVPDPYRRPAAEYRECFAVVEDAVDRLVRALG
ncbi:hypothetical protein [Trujillonella humicola]|uniref:arsenate reductase/protein-tyrosine-phosphatase family protein n=1 Tax=Trujillonella humicola TaxID=3383699 RepID=UPI003906167F